MTPISVVDFFFIREGPQNKIFSAEFKHCQLGNKAGAAIKPPN